MDWNQQAQEMVNNWTESQKRLMDAYFESMTEMSKSPSERFWDQTIATGKQAINNTLSTQREWVSAWVENLKNIQGLPSQAVDSAEQYRDMTNSWLDSQGQLWNSWFDMLKNIDMSQYSGNISGTTSDPYQLWQENTKKMMETQADMMNSWLKAYGGEKDDG